MDALFLHSCSVAPSTSAVNYIPVDGSRGTPNATESRVSQVVPHALTISNARVALIAAPAGSASYTFTLQKNGADTTIVIVISGSATSGVDSTHTVSYAAGDTISWKITPATTPASVAGITTELTQTATGKFAVLFGFSSAAITATNFLSPTGGNNGSEAAVQAPCPIGGTISNLYVKLDVNPTPGNWTTALRLAGVDQTLSVNTPAGQAAGSVVSDTTHSFSVTAGQLLAVHATAAATPASSRIAGGYTFTPTTDGDAFWLGNVAAVASATATNYGPVEGCANAYTVSEAVGALQEVARALTIKSLYVALGGGSPTAGKNYAVTVNKNAVATAATATVADTNTSANITGLSVSVSDGDLLDYVVVPTGTPTARDVAIGVYYTMAAPSYAVSFGGISASTSGATRQYSYQRTEGGISVGASGIVHGTPQILTPFRIKAAGGWTGPNNAPADVSQISETTPNDSTYLQSGMHPVNDVLRVQLNAGNPPVSGPVTLKVRYQKNVVPGIENIDLVVKLYAGATLITTRTYTNIGSVVEDDYTLTTAEVALIPDYSDMEVEFTANHQ